MRGRRNSISASEKSPPRTAARAIAQRRRAAFVLAAPKPPGCSAEFPLSIQRLEKAGKFSKVRLAGAPSGVVFHKAAQVHALAEGVESDAAPRA